MDDKRKKKKRRQMRTLAIVLGIALAMTCKHLPEGYRTVCKQVSQIVSLSC